MFTFGGLIGEIILVFSVVQDYFCEKQIPYPFVAENFDVFLLTLIERDLITYPLNLALC